MERTIAKDSKGLILLIIVWSHQVTYALRGLVSTLLCQKKKVTGLLYNIGMSFKYDT